MSRYMAAIPLACALALLSPAQAPDIGGLWYGTFSPNGAPVEISILFQTRGDGWTGRNRFKGITDDIG